ncbi:MAG: hypothetical protein K0A98_08990 [Trueperaceae bacterium]|nr:hypothetical protein [Trueperaceae bacterium]
MTTPLDLVRGALALDPEAFRALLAPAAADPRLGLAVVYLAGLSLALGQSVVLFAERVSPRRFVSTLAVQAALFLAAFMVWAVSVWWVARVGFDAARPLRDVVAVVGLAYAPQLFGVLVLAPYLGGPLQALLSVWTLLATLVAASAVFGLTLAQAVACTAGGWLLSQLLQRTLGRPVVRAGRRVRAWVAGIAPDARGAPGARG